MGLYWGTLCRGMKQANSSEPGPSAESKLGMTGGFQELAWLVSEKVVESRPNMATTTNNALTCHSSTGKPARCDPGGGARCLYDVHILAF